MMRATPEDFDNHYQYHRLNASAMLEVSRKDRPTYSFDALITTIDELPLWVPRLSLITAV
jgi:hypothetical protein